MPEEEPIIDLHSDDHFMREALRQATRAYEADEVPGGGVGWFWRQRCLDPLILGAYYMFLIKFR